MTTQDTISKVQAVICEIMQQIDTICRRHNLTYFAIGGTALGAVRHQGFIPWDDDIDIGMPRKDYEAFMRYAAEELPQGYFLQTFATEKKTPFYFAKIRKDNTKFVEFYLRDLDIHQGIFVDIFPFDNVPDNPVVEKLHYRLCRFFYQAYLCKSLTTVCSSRLRSKDNYKGIVCKQITRRILHTLLLPVPKKWIYGILDRCVRMFNNKPCKELAHIVRRRLRARQDILYPIQYLPFEDFMMPVPNDYHSYLSAQYTNYTNLPPESKRVGHLPYMAEFDTQEMN